MKTDVVIDAKKMNILFKFLFNLFIVFSGILVASRGLNQRAEAHPPKPSINEKEKKEEVNAKLIPDTALTVMNYNIKGMDGIFNGNSKKNLKKIMEEIAKKFQNGTAPDIILFQEVFTKESNKIVKSLNTPELYPYRAKGPDDEGHIYNSGLVTLSRYPIISNDLVKFESDCTSWDCNANKGAQLVQIWAEGWPEPIRVLNTHMQATNEHDKIRFNQIVKLKNFYSQFENTKLNTIFAGDFNTKPTRPSYEFFKQTFKEFYNVGEFCSSNTSCQIHPGVSNNLLYVDSKDHQFYTCSSNSAMNPVGFVRNFNNEVDGLELSDHKAYQVQYKINWNKKGCK